jgi:hypothetical protein
MMRYKKNFYNKYKNYILFNKNIIIAGAAAFVVGIFLLNCMPNIVTIIF